MTRVRFHIVLGLCLVLAGCATTEQRCVAQATRDLRVIDVLILETEANLARGYAIETETTVSPRLSFCTGYRDRVGVSFCTGDRLVERERAVAIDPVAERRKLDDLRARRVVLARQAEQVVAGCRAG
ncbi:hypothetical protein [Ovoidimarina sediminis]|uniref:hypothetical protein n=1 Tax=Ovoidimarina sediminis TaxID=3079856 RepID=UPI0029081B74|nr:hypothetical protein [Rhodophyticola sp. MJ-SS7]MDU8944394.1 hypothetical protein [Rhodophyticola sp. MJ-SS7]